MNSDLPFAQTYPKVIILVLNWNGINDTIECIESLKTITYPNYVPVVIDNGSKDNSVSILNAKYPGIKVICNKENYGFAGGNNIGMRYALENDADFVLLLNNDTVVESNFLDELVKIADSREDIGFAGPKVYYYNYHGRKDVINIAGGKFSILKGTASKIGVKQIDQGQLGKVREVNYIEGSCILVRREVIEKIGMLDPVYFSYWEDTDWCIRGYRSNYKSVYVPDAKIWHKVSASTPSKNSAYYLARNRFWFMRRNANAIQFLAFLAYFIIISFWINSCMYALYYRNVSSLLSYLKGTADGIFNYHYADKLS